MFSISIEKRIKIIKIYYENGGSVKTIHRKISNVFGRYNRLSETAIENVRDPKILSNSNL